MTKIKTKVESAKLIKPATKKSKCRQLQTSKQWICDLLKSSKQYGAL